MATPLRDATLRLHDGRSLTYCDWGREGGGPVVLAFHGSPGSRVWWPPGDGRPPGYGGSDPLPGLLAAALD